MVMTQTGLLWILGLTLAFEGVTCLFRFGFGLQSTRDTTWLARFTFGIRIHHGYTGVLLVVVALCGDGTWCQWALRVGAALVLSDLIHHFLVLWPTQGHHEFHLTYPTSRERQDDANPESPR